MIRLFLCAYLLWVSCGFTLAHEVRPAYLKVTQVEQTLFDVSWKQPILDGRRLRISPRFADTCTETQTPKTMTSADSLTKVWQISCDLTQGDIVFEGLQATLTDIFVQIEYQSREPLHTVVKPVNPRLDLSTPQSSAARAYFSIGVEHVAFGWDHLLFIIGLTLLVAPRQIISVATAFTLAHSLTLAITALGFISAPSRPVEILIAASIVMLAIEIMRKTSGRPSLAARSPWIIASLIGLIHGLGFAGALAKIGLPKGDELLALLLFNIGVEAAQIIVIALTVLALWAARLVSVSAQQKTRLTATYCIGAMGAFWMIDRLSAYFTLA